MTRFILQLIVVYQIYKQLEAEIRRQREATNQLLQGLDYDTQNKYMSMKEANFEQQQKAEQLQSQVSIIFILAVFFEAFFLPVKLYQLSARLLYNS